MAPGRVWVIGRHDLTTDRARGKAFGDDLDSFRRGA
jgi:hypothetical protein